MTTLLEKVVEQVQKLPDEQQDTFAMLLMQTLTEFQQANPTAAEHAGEQRPQFGSAKGKIWMAPDFDAPLEDFMDYM